MADPAANARPSSADAKTQAEDLVTAPGPYLLRGTVHGASFEVIVPHEAAVNNVHTALMAGKNVTSENGAVTVVHNDRGDHWVQAPATAAQLDAAARRQVAESPLRLGDLVEYDARTVTFPDGPKHVPGGQGHIRDVWAGQGQAVARIELEDGTFDVPPLEDLRPA
ncbi:hypothetical protein ABZV34_27060 [Streptomyces sp. NPDC005195]|uniref:hypothetical protein n=1 Tax=Streptomyces sp. NPDC005195 TaxID=3154561 RepID=UPI0033A31BBC